MRYFRVLTIYYIISLALHFLLGLAIFEMPPERLKTKPQTFVDLIQPPELARRPHQNPRNEKQFVRQVDLPDRLLSKEKNEAKFASEEERYVLEQQRARLNDMTANRSSEASAQAAKSKKQNQSQEAKQATAEPPSEIKTKFKHPFNFKLTPPFEQKQRGVHVATSANGDVATSADNQSQQAAEESPPAERQAPSIGGLEHGVSSFGESVPDSIKFGDFTALNTDRHLFYSFYARMEEKIRGRWVNYARAALFSMANDPRKSTGKEVWVTKLEVLLDREGHYVRSVLHEGSGLSSLDQAPVQAFHDAAFFPNPPPEMVKADGMIHIYYSFNVNVGPGSVAGN